jgi:hypothetical protein
LDPTYFSVTKFFLDLKAHLLANGLTLNRQVGGSDLDVILDTGSGFLRLQKKTVSPTVVAVGWDFGADADLLEVSAFDAERILPFTIDPSGEFAPTFHWYAPTKTMCFHVIGPEVGPGYRIDCCIDTQTTQVLHRNRFNPQFEPNAKDTGGPYISAGA